MSWPELSLNDCSLYIQRGKSPKYADSGNVMIINQKCIRWTSFELEWAKRWDGNAVESLEYTRYLVLGDVLINSTGEGTIGRANVWESFDSNWVADSHVTIVRPNPCILDSWWLKYWLESPVGQEFVTHSKVGGTKQTELGSGKIKTAKIPLPAIDEQRRIVARIKECMERVEEIERLRTENFKMAGVLYKSRLTDLYDEIALGSPLNEFGDIVADTKLGLVRSKNEQSEDRTFPYVKMQNISNAGHLDLSNLIHVDANNKEVEANRIEIGDFLFNTRNSYELVGKTAIVPSHSNTILFNNNILRVRFKDVVLSSFVNHLFQHKFVRTQLNFRKNKTTSVCAIYWKMLATVKIPTPPIDVQQDFVNEMDCFKSLQMEIVSEMKNCDKKSGQLRESILRKAFAGEL